MFRTVFIKIVFFTIVAISVFSHGQIVQPISAQNSDLVSTSTPKVEPDPSSDKSNDGIPQYWKGNLHTHSLWSDGDDFPEMIAKWYLDHEYHFLALTDHNVLSDIERWMNEKTIVERGGDSAIPKCIAAWGDEWVERRVDPKTGENQLRLKKLDDYRDQLESENHFLMIPAEEISDQFEGFPVHLNATNLQSVIQPVGGASVVEVINNNLRAVQEQSDETSTPMLFHVNHPNFGWAVTAEDLAAVTNDRFFEVYNGHPGVNQLGDDLRPSIERMWDIANTIRIGQMGAAPMFGLATDDCHYYHGRPGSQPGRGWVMVKATNLDANELINAIHKGDFYASSGVLLSEIKYDAQARKLSLNIEPDDNATFTTHFVGTLKDYEQQSKPRLNADGTPLRATRIYSKDIGQVLATDSSLTPSYTLTGDELYVRAIVTSNQDHPNPSFQNQKQQAWVQPVGWERQSQD